MDDTDDGLLLNFSPAPVQKAGTKRPRQSGSGLNKVDQQQPQQQPQQSQQRQQPAKKQRVDAGAVTGSANGPRTVNSLHGGSAKRSNRRPLDPSNPHAPRQAADGKPRAQNGGGQVISSLFTSNPRANIDSKTMKASEQQLPADPSNAPLDTSTFAGLGLDPLLVAHLAGRMSIGKAPTGIQRLALPLLLGNDRGGGTRDAFIQAQTGSGKTLTYLLPIVQSLLPLSEESFIDRSVGTLAVILAPTRELARQIYDVLEKLLSLPLSVRDAKREAGTEEQDPGSEDEEAQPRRTRWLVPGLLTGGSTRTHEKARLRRGCPIVVATPGRLLDHLQNTSSFNVGRCRWLVLDEADRLLELGFADTLAGIVRALDGRKRLAVAAAREALGPDGAPERISEEELTDSLGVHWWAQRRRSVLCSATLDEGVQVLAGNTLKEPIILRGGAEPTLPEPPRPGTAASHAQTAATGLASSSTGGPSPDQAVVQQGRFSAPAQLAQHVVAVPAKLRLVTLLALLRFVMSSAESATGAAKDEKELDTAQKRIIVFMSCTDSVDFHWQAMGAAHMREDSNVEDEQKSDSDEEPDDPVSGTGPIEAKSERSHGKERAPTIAQDCVFLPGAPIYRLHGAMSQAERIASLRAFSSGRKDGADGSKGSGGVLFCTSVAARGLDLPRVGAVIQLDAPTEGGAEEYVHRIGRTARVGRAGQSWLLLLPSERGLASRLEAAMKVDTQENEQSRVAIREQSVESVLKRGFGGRGDEYEARATDAQLSFERWVLRSEEVSVDAVGRQSFTDRCLTMLSIAIL